jgi:hypothetical protein
MSAQARVSRAKAVIGHHTRLAAKPWKGNAPQLGTRGAADAVGAPGPQAVPDFQVGQLADTGVGCESSQAVAIDVFEAQRSPEVGPFPAHDGPHTRRPGS